MAKVRIIFYLLTYIVRYSKEHNVSELRLALCNGPNGVSPTPHLRTETHPVSGKLFSSF
jgi:hypothetical protein